MAFGRKVEAGPLLSQINDPADLRRLPVERLPQVCAELRDFLIRQIAEVGGHFGGSLGVVELTVAIHYVFNTPEDLLVWDVGHQAYGHKVLTGRRDRLHTIRQLGGISGFPKRDESVYDTFGTGHSSTSISAALGMAIASLLEGNRKRCHIVVIGDGALTAGMAYEALNNAGEHPEVNLLIILNDNAISIDPNVGAIARYLDDLATSRLYNRVRDRLWDVLGSLEKMGLPARRYARELETALKGFLSERGTFFEALGIRYFGPEDGHDVLRLVNVFRELRELKGPRLLHVRTVKGKGYPAAEKDQVKWHSTEGFIVETGAPRKPKSHKPEPPKYQDVFGHTIVELARQNPRIVGITPAMPTGSSLKYMMDEIPDRAFDVGIAEQHAVTFAAGLATRGFIPYVAIYSTFLQRAYDQLIHDVALQNLHVVFCIDRAGLVGADGPTHHGAFDIAYLRCIPNMIVSAPANEVELRHLMYTAQLEHIRQPFAIRYPRGQGVMVEWRQPFKEVEVGRGECVLEGEDVAILAFGHPVNWAIEAARVLAEQHDLYPAVFNMRFVKPIDGALLEDVFGRFRHIITVEDGSLMGGFGSAVLEWAADHALDVGRVVRLGIPDVFATHGKPAELYRLYGYDAQAIVERALALVGKKVRHSR